MTLAFPVLSAPQNTGRNRISKYRTPRRKIPAITPANPPTLCQLPSRFLCQTRGVSQLFVYIRSQLFVYIRSQLFVYIRSQLFVYITSQLFVYISVYNTKNQAFLRLKHASCLQNKLSANSLIKKVLAFSRDFKARSIECQLFVYIGPHLTR